MGITSTSSTAPKPPQDPSTHARPVEVAAAATNARGVQQVVVPSAAPQDVFDAAAGEQPLRVAESLARFTNPVDLNEQINLTYQHISRNVQRLIDPSFAAGAPTPGVLPNWYAIAAHASPQAGRSMLAVEQTLKAVDLLKGKPHLHHRADVFDALRLPGPARKQADTVATMLERAGVPTSSATAIATLSSLMGAQVGATGDPRRLGDPRLVVALAYRIWNLAKEPGTGLLGMVKDALRGLFGGNNAARDSAMLGRVEEICRTFLNMLGAGNRTIFRDIGASVEKFSDLIGASGGRVSPEQVLTRLALPLSSPEGSRRVYEWALAHASDDPQPVDFRPLAQQGLAANDLVLAGFALYAQAGQTQDVARKNELVRIANNLTAWREQYEVVQPDFEGRRPAELDRPRVMSAFTPLIQVEMGPAATWQVSDFARAVGDRDGNPFTAPVSEYNWSKFDDRWPAILNSFDVAYRNLDTIWQFAEPRTRLGVRTPSHG